VFVGLAKEEPGFRLAEAKGGGHPAGEGRVVLEEALEGGKELVADLAFGGMGQAGELQGDAVAEGAGRLAAFHLLDPGGIGVGHVSVLVGLGAGDTRAHKIAGVGPEVVGVASLDAAEEDVGSGHGVEAVDEVGGVKVFSGDVLGDPEEAGLGIDIGTAQAVAAGLAGTCLEDIPDGVEDDGVAVAVAEGVKGLDVQGGAVEADGLEVVDRRSDVSFGSGGDGGEGLIVGDDAFAAAEAF